MATLLGVILTLLLMSIKISGNSNNFDKRVSHQDGRRGLRVTTILVEPYVMHNHGANGSFYRKYEGYIVDLLEKISYIVGFRFRIVLNRDNSYGYRKPDGTWDGMIGDLTQKRAEIAAGPMYVTDQRKRAVDFTIPFLEVQATVLIKKHMGSKTIVKSVEDLLGSPYYKYGTLNRGIIKRAFRMSNHSLIRFMWNAMKSDQTVFCDTNAEGIRRVRQENYAYILPNNIADYMARRHPCDLITLDNFLMRQHFALAVPKGSALLAQLNNALRILDDNGYLSKLYYKWWVQKGDCDREIRSSKIYSSGAVHYSSVISIAVLVSITTTLYS